MKNKIIYLICIVQITIPIAFTQEYFPFPESNATWNTVGDNLFSGEEWHFRYAIYGDTIINSMEYSKIYEMYDSTLIHPNSTYFAAIRENDQKQIFCLIPGFSDFLLYDFSLNIGDTIWYEIGGGLCYNSVDFWDFNHYRFVTEIDSFLLENNQYRRSLILNGSLGYQTWVEGIGCIHWYGLLNPIISHIALCGDDYQFACFKQNDEILFLDNPFCDKCFCQLLTSTNENMERKLVSILPNPSNGNVTIRLNYPGSLRYNVEVYNLTGQKIMERQLSINNKIQISGLTKGLYLIKTMGIENKLIEITKLVVE